MTVTSCVDCGTTILGERARCPRCHDAHAVELAAAPPVDHDVDPGDDATTAPRPRHRSVGQILLQYLVGAQFIAAILLGAFLVLTRGCR